MTWLTVMINANISSTDTGWYKILCIFIHRQVLWIEKLLNHHYCWQSEHTELYVVRSINQKFIISLYANWGSYTEAQFECFSSISPLKKTAAGLWRIQTTLCCNKHAFVLYLIIVLHVQSRMNSLVQKLRFCDEIKRNRIKMLTLSSYNRTSLNTASLF